MKEHFARMVDAGTLQGAGFLLARDGKVFSHEVYGRRTYLPGSDGLAPDTIKRIASITKLFTATAIMKLVEDGDALAGAAGEDDHPRVRHPDARRHHHLEPAHPHLGLAADGGYFTEPYPVERWELLGEKDWIVKGGAGRARGLPSGRAVELLLPLGFTVLAEIVSRVSGSHFNDFVQTQIFQPLGMTRSFLEVPEKLWPEVCLIGDWEEMFLRRAKERKGAPDGGGGVYSTLRDLFVFGQCFLNLGTVGSARILGRKTAEEMTRNQLSGVPAFHWGKRLPSLRQGLGWEFFCDGSTVGRRRTITRDGAGATCSSIRWSASCSPRSSRFASRGIPSSWWSRGQSLSRASAETAERLGSR